jgi:hypothetical protein
MQTSVVRTRSARNLFSDDASATGLTLMQLATN